MTKHPNDPTLRSFVSVDPVSHFPIQNLPFGVFSTEADATPRIGVAIGDMILDVTALEELGLIDLGLGPVFQHPNLNAFLALGRASWIAARRRISELLRHDNPQLRDNVALCGKLLVPADRAQMHLPVTVGGFSDYLSSLHHTQNCARILGANDEFHPNWHHMPLAYNGRASSVVVSGTPLRRPSGQIRREDGSTAFVPTKSHDFELEVAMVVGAPNRLGEPISVQKASDHIFGVVLLNDWSARDVQYWEAKPLGVFDSKNFMTSISPWIVTMEALEPFRSTGPEQDPVPLPYLRDSGNSHIDARLQALIRPEGAPEPSLICQSSMRDIYWSFAQQLAHQTSAGCNVRPGDLLATGTVSCGSAAGEMGCLLEASYDGKHRIPLEHGGSRLYLEDGDEVILTGWCEGDGYRVGFGQCVGTIVAPNGA